MTDVRRAVRTGSATAAFAATALIASTAQAGGLLLYEFGTGEPGLAAAGYAARAQDASTAFTNPAGMTRLDGTQVLVGGQLMWLNTQFSVDSDTSPGLGSGDGGRAFGSNGYVPGGGAFLTHRVSPDLALGFAVAGNFGSMLDYEDDWVGRYRVQVGDLVGVSVMPSIAYRVNDKLSLGAGINGMYGMFDQKVAINNAVPSLSDGRLEIDDNTWGWGGNVGVLYEPTPGTRLGLTYTSVIDLDFSGRAKFSGIGPILNLLLQSRGLLDARVDVGAKVPQQVMGSVYTEISDRWALMGNVGWQDWSEFGEVEIGIDNTQNPAQPHQPTVVRRHVARRRGRAVPPERSVESERRPRLRLRVPGRQRRLAAVPGQLGVAAWCRRRKAGQRIIQVGIHDGAALRRQHRRGQAQHTAPGARRARQPGGVVRPDAVRRADRVRQLGPVTARHPAAQVER